MKLTPWFADRARTAAYAVGIAGTFLILAALVWMLQRTPPPAIDQARAELRRKNIAEMQAADHLALTTYDWLDKTKGIVRLPIDRALELSIQLWQDPAAGRSNLLSRLEKATAKPPEQANPYE
jgi:hypothetical protein